jgi:aspartyl/asparaginyl beta-hydroxylase (cupin superfamily)
MQTYPQDNVPEPWLNFLNPDKSGGCPDIFYDPATLNWTAKVEAHWEEFRIDILNFLETNSHELKSFYKGQQKWKSFGLFAWGMRLSEERCTKCKKTIDLLKEIPGLITVMVGVMEPFSEIKGHRGDTDAIYRCHLPLIVPGSLPDIGFQVEDEKRSWEEGKLLIFNDGKFHQAWNNTPHRRIVLIFDVMKPEYQKRSVEICSRVLSSLLIQKISQKIGLPRIFKFLMHTIFKKVIALNLKLKQGSEKSLL